MAESPTWYGLVIVQADSTGTQDIRIEDTSKIRGAIITDSPASDLRLTNNVEIQYSSEALDMVQTDLESTGGFAATRVITDIIWYE